MTQELMTRPESQVQAETMEKVLLGGNLAVLTPAERMAYYKAVCESVGLNPLTRPFEYLMLSGKVVLYARREATEQLRKIHGVSVERLEKTFSPDGDLYIVEAQARDRSGRADISTAAVSIKNLTGEMKANTLMKCETKAKRRVTLSICGLGMLDETEVDTIKGAVKVDLGPASGEIPAGDDVPAVDVRADVAGKFLPLEGPQTPEEKGGTPTPAPAEIVAPSASQTPKKDYPFLREAKRQKERIGPSQYYAVLGLAGFEHSSEIQDRETKKDVFRAWQAIPTPNAREQEELL